MPKKEDYYAMIEAKKQRARAREYTRQNPKPKKPKTKPASGN